MNRDTPDPDGGKFGRDAQGELTGYVAEKVLAIFEEEGRLPTLSAKHRQAGVKLISELMTAAGLTTVHDVMVSKEDLIAYQDALNADELRFRVYMLMQAEPFQTLLAAGIRPGSGKRHAADRRGEIVL